MLFCPKGLYLVEEMKKVLYVTLSGQGAYLQEILVCVKGALLCKSLINAGCTIGQDILYFTICGLIATLYQMCGLYVLALELFGRGGKTRNNSSCIFICARRCWCYISSHAIIAYLLICPKKAPFIGIVRLGQTNSEHL